MPFRSNPRINFGGAHRATLVSESQLADIDRKPRRSQSHKSDKVRFECAKPIINTPLAAMRDGIAPFEVSLVEDC
jgi:hypothetical protein